MVVLTTACIPLVVAAIGIAIPTYLGVAAFRAALRAAHRVAWTRRAKGSENLLLCVGTIWPKQR